MKNKINSLSLKIGLILLLIYFILYFNAIHEISSFIRLTGYIAFLFLFVNLSIYFANKKQIILVNVFITFTLILSVELVCFFLLSMPSGIKKDFSLPYLPEDHIARNIGDVPYSDSVYHKVLVNGNDTVFDVKNTVDHFNKRYTPGKDTLKKKHALFFGCSIAFGEGLEDDQTLAYRFQKESGEYNSYNFALSGHGTNHMLARLKFQNLTTQVSEKNGVAFYIFFWDHIFRSIGSMSRYCDWLSNAPYYEIKENHLVRNKMFKNGRYYTSKFYELIYQTNIVKYFKVDFPLKLNDSHIDLVCEMIKESKNEYQNQFGKNPFYVVLYPTYIEYTPEQFQLFKNCLTKKKIDYIDLNDFLKYSGEHTLGGDPHPNSKTNELLGKELLKRYLKR